MVKYLSEIIQELGKAVSSLAGMKATSELADFIHKALTELIEKEAEIDAEIKTTLATEFETCRDLALEYLDKCKAVREEWNAVDSLVSRKEHSGLLLRIEKLLKALGELKEEYKGFIEKLNSVQRSVVEVEKKCKMNSAKCKLSKENSITGSVVFGGLLGTIIYETASGPFALVPLSVGYGAAAYAVYNRYKWLTELEVKLEKHLTGLEKAFQQLKDKKEELRNTQSEMDKLPKAMETAKEEIERTQKEHEKEVANAQVVKI